MSEAYVVHGSKSGRKERAVPMPSAEEVREACVMRSAGWSVTSIAIRMRRSEAWVSKWTKGVCS